MRFFLLQAAVVVPAVLSLLPVALAAQGLTLAGTVFRAVQPHASYKSDRVPGIATPTFMPVMPCHAVGMIKIAYLEVAARKAKPAVVQATNALIQVLSCVLIGRDVAPHTGIVGSDETCVKDNGVPLCQAGSGGSGGGSIGGDGGSSGGGDGGGDESSDTAATSGASMVGPAPTPSVGWFWSCFLIILMFY
ncbi:hypothetical protein D9756_004618 [Leucocoprinus leucothites]|uniref:Uncharacterized protein n=1 Tax=Leucocoprinus leucothites TaxID=201217 RepID=A0A8H5G913_9AGAR|nr:hypothetical protein D9756_004618 [Leucoagaricus leucothites]